MGRRARVTREKWRGYFDSPIQHSRRAQGVVLTTSGGSTPILRHKHSATLQVFIYNMAEKEGGRRKRERGRAEEERDKREGGGREGVRGREEDPHHPSCMAVVAHLYIIQNTDSLYRQHTFT